MVAHDLLRSTRSPALRNRPAKPQPSHNPTASVLAFSLETNYAGSLHQLESALPKVKVQNVRLARQQVVANAEAFHCAENALDVSRGHVIGKLGDRIISGLQRMQHVGA